MAQLINSFLLVLALLFILLFSGEAEVYDITNFGAIPDGTTDSSKPLLEAWASACGSTEPPTILVPQGDFLVGKVILEGPCQSSQVTISIEGTLVAPVGAVGSGDDDAKWILFHRVDGLELHGGVINGRGSSVWSCKSLSCGDCPTGASSLTISNSTNVSLDGLSSIDSELFHIAIINSEKVTVQQISISAPTDSPNTDGIHVEKSSCVSITNAAIQTGDDCISIGPGTANLWIEDVTCGPGHGISIGSLGRTYDEEGVADVTVKNTVFTGSQNGLRIKTWGRPSRGFVRGVLFDNATMQDVQNPIIIDQNYCPHKEGCPGKYSGIKISDVTYKNIRGSSASDVAVNFDCSPTNPCTGIELGNVDLTRGNNPANSVCQNADGTASGIVNPPSCLS